DLTKLKKRLESAKAEMNQPFPQEAEYQALLQEQAEINAQLTVGDDNISDSETESDSNAEQERESDVVASAPTSVTQTAVRRFSMRR
ncbi:MAG: hypothetical protein UIH27_12990, partial [Ruminococcus sp.]|nr:hypothetical protein [Ruminococcus sp.]